MAPLGSSLQIASFAVKGPVTHHLTERILEQLTATMQMSPCHQTVVYDYPVDGKGGKGFTAIQPITESFLAVDAWPDHSGAYVVIASCKPFDTEAVAEVLMSLCLTIVEWNNNTLGLVHE